MRRLPGAGNFSRSVTLPWCAMNTSLSAIAASVTLPSQACGRLIGEEAMSRTALSTSIRPLCPS